MEGILYNKGARGLQTTRSLCRANAMSDFHPDHHRSIRLHGYDYAQAGAYFGTIVANARENIFGTLIDNAIQLTQAGEIAAQEWARLPRRFPAVELDEFILMPNHLHGIILLAGPNGGVPRGPAPEQFGAPVKGSILTILRSFKSSVTQRCQWLARNDIPPVWQGNYYEHIIRSEDELNRIRQYILENPLHWPTDRENTDRTLT